MMIHNLRNLPDLAVEGHLAKVFCNDLKYLSNHFGNSQAGSHSEEYILECISKDAPTTINSMLEVRVK